MFRTNPEEIPDVHCDAALAGIAERMDAHLLAAPAAPALCEVPPAPVDAADYEAQRAWIAEVEAICRPLVERADWEAKFLEMAGERQAAVQRSQQRWLSSQARPYRAGLERAAAVGERVEADDPSDPRQRLKALKRREHHLVFEHPFEREGERPKLCAWNSHLEDRLKRARRVLEFPHECMPKTVEAARQTIAECEPELARRKAELAAVQAEIAELEKRIAETKRG